MPRSIETPEVTPMRIIGDLWAARAAQVLIAGTELDVFTEIAHGRKTAREIARATHTKPNAMERLLDALVGIGYLTRRSNTYGLAPVAAEFLVRDRPGYVGGMVDETRLAWDTWGHLTEVVRTGRPVSMVDSEAGARDFFPRLVRAIFPMSFGAAQAAASALPARSRQGIEAILDVAAGAAPWSIAFALELPGARVTALDFGEMLDVAREYTERFGVLERYHFLDGNLRTTDFGREKYDLVLLGHIIHSEGAKWGRRLIAKSYRALRPGGTLLIAEMVPNDTRSGPAIPLVFGLNMLLHTDAGDVFTMKEYRQWLKEAGFRKVRTLEAPAPSPLILATK